MFQKIQTNSMHAQSVVTDCVQFHVPGHTTIIAQTAQSWHHLFVYESGLNLVGLQD